ncbi:MAG: hypothetical protein HYU52_17670 [Acidobacteria bacterium]|nr:hypothetical protein [Acidobacteriota bacterium]
MGIYGEYDGRFRDRPSSLALVSVSLFSTLACALISSAIVSFLRVMITRTVRHELPLALYFPFAADPFSGLYPLRSDQSIRAAAPAIAIPLALALVLLFFYPTTQKLAGRLNLHTFVTCLVVFGTLAPVLDPALFRDFRFAARLEREPALAMAAAAAVLLAFVLGLIERRTFRILGNVYDTSSPGKRLYLWLLRVPPPFLALAASAQLSGWTAGAIASLVVVVATFFETISHLPKVHHESFSDVRMREAAATWPFIAALLIGASVWAFGSEPLRLTQRAVRVEGTSLSFVPLDALQASQKETIEPKIEMNWHKERK